MTLALFMPTLGSEKADFIVGYLTP